MISITYQPDEPIRGFLPGFCSYPKENRPIYDCVGSLLILTSNDGDDLDTGQIEAQFGFLSQGKKAFGALRDKDVLHISGHGSVAPPLGVSSIPLHETSFDSPINEWDYDTLFLAPFGVVTPISDIIHWGSDFVHGHTFLSPEWTDSRYTGRTYLSHVRGIVQAAEFQGDQCMVTTHAWPHYFDFLDSAGTKQTALSMGYGWVRWYLREKGPQPRVWCSPQYGVLRGSSSIVNGQLDDLVQLPSGRYPLRSLVPHPELYGVTCQATQTYGPVPSQFGGGSLSQALAIKDQIESPEFLELVQSQFVNTPTELTVEQLSRDLLRSQHFVDANLLLTLMDPFQYADTNLEQWGRMAKAMRKKAIKPSPSFKSFIRMLKASKTDKTVLQSPFSWNDALKFVRSASRKYLGVDYGLMPTVRDLQSLSSGFTRLFQRGWTPRRLHSRRSAVEENLWDNSTINTKLVLTVETTGLPSGVGGDIQGVIKGMKEWGIYPNLTSLYDAIPFSFVVDWFVNFGNVAKIQDDVIDSNYYPITEVIESSKRVWTPLPSTLWPGATANVQFSVYSRWISTSLTLPPASLDDLYTSPSGITSHWAEGMALVLSRGNSPIR